MALTYAQLVVAVSDYCENTFDTTDMNTMIKQAEQRIYNTVQIANLRKNVTGTLTASNKYLSCPDDFLSVYSLAIYPSAGGSYIYLLNKDVNFMRDAYPNPATTGTPKHYAIFGPQSTNVNELSFIVGPTPNTAYGAELHYYYYPESIVTALTTWLGDNFDSALLYGTLCEAYTYMKGEPDMVALVNQRYVQSIALLKNLGDGKQRQDAYRDGQVRVQVS
tara:strand:- start:1305 stop:1964 length:660 start_codon:yes stop_codon:yes gene_type:complete